MFNHRTVATDLDPGGQSCGECHARDYCVNCHSTGAVTVDHDAMATNHAQVIRDQGNTACAYCHQPVYCARCHEEPVLPVTTPFLQGSTTPEGVSWPLAMHFADRRQGSPMMSTRSVSTSPPASAGSARSAGRC